MVAMAKIAAIIMPYSPSRKLPARFIRTAWAMPTASSMTPWTITPTRYFADTSWALV